MTAVVGALVAGVLTTLAPCVLPLLPVIVGGSAVARRRRAVVITASLGASITLFTLVLKASTTLLAVDPRVWSMLSGGVLVLLGVVAAFPDLWERLSARLDLQGRSDARLRAALKPITREATVILVAQRVSSIRDADQIVVLDDGQVVGQGTHTELLSACATYQEIVASQLSAQEAS